MADVASTLAAWLSTTASNAPSGSTTIGTGLDDNLRELQGVVVRGLSHKGSDIASVAGTTDIGAVEGLMHDITGALAITGLGAVRAGILKVLKFEAAASFVHSASLICPGAANIVFADGDVAIVISEGSGTWRVLHVMKANGSHLGPVLGTEQASTSGTAINFTGIPPWVKRITIMFDGVSTSGTSNILVRLGDAGGAEDTGYAGRGAEIANAAAIAATDFSTGMGIPSAIATHSLTGSVVLTLMDAANFTWVMTGTLCTTATTVAMYLSASVKSLSAALDRVQITTVNGTDTFDAGAINILYE